MADGGTQLIENESATAFLRWMRRMVPGAFATSAYALAERARWRAGQEGEQLFRRAYGRFENLYRDNPVYAPGLLLWGVALTDRALRLRLADAERMNAEAEEKLSLALARAPDDVRTMASLALVMARRAWLKNPDVALPLLARARELMLRELSLTPYDPQTLNVWAMVLYGEVHAGADGDIDRRLADAFDKFESAYSHTGLGSLFNGWGTIRFAQAERASGSEAERLLRDAKDKYAEVVARDPGRSTYNLACVCARLGQLDECRQWLEKSGEPGRYVIREEMAADPELSDVRSCKWFQAFFTEECPSCGLANPPEAIRCECGYDFKGMKPPETPGWQINLSWRQKLSAYWSISWPACLASLFMAILLTRVTSLVEDLVFFGIQAVLTPRLIRKDYRSFRVGLLRTDGMQRRRFSVGDAALVYLWILGPQLALLLAATLTVWWLRAKLPPEALRYISASSLWLRFLAIGPYAIGLALRVRYPGFRLQAYGYRFK